MSDVADQRQKTVQLVQILCDYGALTDFDGALQRYGSRAALQGQLWFQAEKRFAKPVNWQTGPLIADATA